MNYKTKGEITAISEAQTFDSGAKKLSFQIDTKEQYNNIYSFDLFKNADNLQHLDNFIEWNKVGDKVEVEFNIDCREYQGKYYTNLSCWKCSKATDPVLSEEVHQEEESDLPF